MRIKLTFGDCWGDWDFCINVDDDANAKDEAYKFAKDYIRRFCNETAEFLGGKVVERNGGINPSEQVYTPATTVWVTSNFDGCIISVYRTKNAAIWDRMEYVKQSGGGDYDIDTLVASARALVLAREMVG